MVDEVRLKGCARSLLFEELLLFKTECRILVTGIQQQNKLEELFNLLQFLNSWQGRKKGCKKAGW